MRKRNFQRQGLPAKPVVSRAQRLADLGRQTFFEENLKKKSQDENVHPPESPCPGEISEDDFNSFLTVFVQDKPDFSTPRQPLIEVTQTKNVVAPIYDESISSPPTKVAKEPNESPLPSARRSLFNNIAVKVAYSSSLSLLTAYGSEDSCSCEARSDDNFAERESNTDLNNNGNNYFNLLPSAGEKVVDTDRNQTSASAPMFCVLPLSSHEEVAEQRNETAASAQCTASSESSAFDSDLPRSERDHDSSQRGTGTITAEIVSTLTSDIRPVSCHEVVTEQRDETSASAQCTASSETNAFDSDLPRNETDHNSSQRGTGTITAEIVSTLTSDIRPVSCHEEVTEQRNETSASAQCTVSSETNAFDSDLPRNERDQNSSQNRMERMTSEVGTILTSGCAERILATCHQEISTQEVEITTEGMVIPTREFEVSLEDELLFSLESSGIGTSITGSTSTTSNDNSSDLSATVTFTEEISTDCAAEVLAAVDPSHGDAIVIPLDSSVADTPGDTEQDPTQRDEPGDDGNDLDDPDFPKPRTPKPNTWKKNKVKLLCDSGQAHTSLRGKERAAKAMGQGCDERCKRKCHFNFSEEERKEIFSQFWGIQNHTMQWYFISKCVRPQEVKKRTVVILHAQDPRRKQTNGYYLGRDGKDTQVCQKFFLATLAIGERWVRSALEKQKSFNGCIPKDGRGKSSKPTRVKTFIREDVMNHIKKFPTVEGHYTRKDSKSRYLPENLNRRKMHSLYVIEKEGAQTPKEKIATLRQYRDVFRKEFKIKFFRPRKDQCPRCLSWRNKTPQEKTDEDAKKKYEKHLSDKEISSKMKEKDIEEIKSSPQLQQTRCVMTVDLEKVFLCPKGENGDFFYKSKLSCCNLSIFVSGEQKGFCYVWDQTEARRGSAEITSCLWNFISKKVQEGVKEFIIYSDNCSAQNKNQNLFSMYTMASIRFSITITHRYLEVGHTHMEVDAIHATIETSIKYVDIFEPKEFYNRIRIAKKTPPRYEVIELKQEIIFKFEAAAGHQRWDKLGTSQFKEVHVTHEKPGIGYFKTEYMQDLQSACVLKKSPGRPVNWKTFRLDRKYMAKIPMKPHELKDLQDLCHSGAIPSTYHDFYLGHLPSLMRNAQEPPPLEIFPDVEVSDDESNGDESEDDVEIEENEEEQEEETSDDPNYSP